MLSVQENIADESAGAHIAANLTYTKKKLTESFHSLVNL
jgi:hypothetical protein